jgi:hypothetical protein
MNTYMVTVADPSGRDQRVFVQAPVHDTEDDIARFILDPATRGTKGEQILPDARVIGIRKLAIKRPIHGTVIPEMRKARA